MINLQKDIRGVSPIIATLMLTLIAISAASSFALFVAHKQEARQEAEWQQTIQELEEITILSINPNIENYWLNISLANIHPRNSNIAGILINNNMWLINKTGQPIKYSNDTIFKLESYEEGTYEINLSRDEKINQSVEIGKPITVKVLTILGNSFEKTFYPPTAVIKIDIESMQPYYTNTYILDGSMSDDPGDGYIIKWEWNVTNMTVPITHLVPEPFGRKAQITDTSFLGPSNAYWVNLTVTDNYGMKGKNSFYLDLT
jgi:flagellin-like protein